MPTRHAILLTWQNMEPEILNKFITFGQQKYAVFTRVYFNNGATVKQRLKAAVDAVPAAVPLKVYISGHGGTGVDYITDNTQNKKQTVRDLIQLLKFALGAR